MARTEVLPPSLAVEIAWGISNRFSKDNDAKTQGEVARVDLERLVQSVEKNSGDREKRYVHGTVALIDGAVRTLHIIVAGRDLNIDALDELRGKKREDIEAWAKLSGSFQSIWPRAVTTLFAGTAGAGLSGVLTRWAGLHATDVAVIQGFAVAFAAAAGYFIHGFVIAPLFRKKLTQELIKKDYDRTVYFDQYYERCRLALWSLYERVDSWHEAVFDTRFSDADAKVVAWRVLHGAESTPCPWANKHMKNGWIDPDLWPLCETGGVKHGAVEARCPVFPKKEGWPPTPRALAPGPNP